MWQVDHEDKATHQVKISLTRLTHLNLDAKKEESANRPSSRAL